MAKIAPETHLIDSYRNQNLPWKSIFGEFIDNAFDAAANRIECRFTSKSRLEFHDNGRGCEDLLVFARLGAHRQNKTTRLGRYGIGAKEAAISCADAIRVRSICKGYDRELYCNWRDLGNKPEWEIEDPTCVHAADPEGTHIILEPLRSEAIERGRWEDLVEGLSLTYTPAIRNGRQIILQRGPKTKEFPLSEFRFPTLEHQIEADLDVDGLSARIKMGLVPEGQVVKHNGLFIASDFRVILSGERIGLGNEPTPGLLGWVDLGAGWKLTKNKDDLSSHKKALAREIYRACRQTIDLSVRRSQTLLLDGVTKELNAVLADILGEGIATRPAKAKRSPRKNDTGAILPVGTDRRHRQAARTQPGQTFLEQVKRGRGLKMALESYGEDGPIAEFNSGIVYLNRDNPIVAEDAKKNCQRSLAVHAVYALAEHFVLFPDGQMTLPFLQQDESATKKISKLSGYLLSRLHSSCNFIVEKKSA